MKNKIIILFCMVAIFMLPCICAQEDRTQELTGTYYSGDTFEFKDTVYLVNVNSYDEIVLSYNDQFLVVRNGTCTWKTTHYQFCVEDIEYDYDEKKKSVRLNIYAREPEITIERTVSSSTIVVGENTTITVTLENDGLINARNVTYTDTFPADINISVPPKYRGHIKVIREKKVTLANESKVQMYTLLWQDDLDKGESVTFMYSLTPTKPVDEEFSANVHYFDGYEWVDEKSETITLVAESYVEIRTSLIDLDYEPSAGATDITAWEEKSPVYAGEDMLLIADLVNAYSENKSVNISDLRFLLPAGVRYIEPYSMHIFDNVSDPNSSYLVGGVKVNKINDHLYNWSGEILKDGKTFVLRLQSTKEGKQVIRIAGDFRKDDLPPIYDHSVIEEFDAKMEDIELESNFKEGAKFTSGQQEYFTLYLVNPNTFINFTDVNITYYTPWTGERTSHADMVRAFGYADILNDNIVIPTVTRSKTFTIYANVSYTTEFGHRLNETFERDISVEAPRDIEVLHNFEGPIAHGSDSVEIDNKEIEVLLQINNKLQKDLESVTITEVAGKDLDPQESISTKVITLPKDTITDVFQYKINPPDRSFWQNFTITTYVSYKFRNESYNYSFDVEVAVKPKTMDIEIIKDLFEEDVTKGQIAHFTYKITNTEDETIRDITLHFPLQHETDVVGARNFTIEKLLPHETVVVNNEESVRMKVNGSVAFKKTKVTFRDGMGNIFSDNSTIVTEDVLQGSLESPAIFLNHTAPPNITAGENFTVNLTVSNRGKTSGLVSVRYLDKVLRLQSSPGVDYSIIYNTSINKTGIVEIPNAVANYTVAGFDYYTASNEVEVYSKAKVEKKHVVLEEIIEEVPVVEKKKIFNIKYLYLAAFIIITCLIIVYIIKRPKEEKGFEFIEK